MRFGPACLPRNKNKIKITLFCSFSSVIHGIYNFAILNKNNLAIFRSKFCGKKRFNRNSTSLTVRVVV